MFKKESAQKKIIWAEPILIFYCCRRLWNGLMREKFSMTDRVRSVRIGGQEAEAAVRCSNVAPVDVARFGRNLAEVIAKAMKASKPGRQRR